MVANSKYYLQKQSTLMYFAEIWSGCFHPLKWMLLCTRHCEVKTFLFTFRCTNGEFYVALGSSMSLTLLVWVGGGLLKRVLYFFGNEPSLGRKSPILLLPPFSLRSWLFLYCKGKTTPK